MDDESPIQQTHVRSKEQIKKLAEQKLIEQSDAKLVEELFSDKPKERKN
jgi:hypothetical protein